MKAVASQRRRAGQQGHALRPSTKEGWDFVGVLTITTGGLTAVVGGTEYSISGHALIADTEEYHPKVGDRITVDGQKYMAVNTIHAPNDAATSVDLVAITR